MDKSTSADIRSAFFRKNHASFIITVLVEVLTSLSGIVSSVVLGEVINAITAADLQKLKKVAWFTLWFAVLETTMEIIKSLSLPYFVHQGMRQYKEAAFRGIAAKGIGAFYQEKTMQYVSALTNDAAVVEEKFLAEPVRLIVLALEFITALACMLYYSWVMTLVIIGLSVPPVLISILMGGELTRREKQVSDQNALFVGRMKDLLGGFAVIKSFRAEGPVQKVFDADNRAVEAVKEHRRRYTGLLSTATGMAGAVMQMGIFLIGAYLAIRGQIAAGTVMIFVNLCNFLMEPIREVPRILAERRAAGGLIDKLMQMMQEHVGHTGSPAPKKIRSAITLRDVNFGYNADAPVLKHLNARFEAGKSYAIVGSSGSGKSTLLNLLMGTYEGYTGEILLEDAELKSLDSDSLYDLMSLVGQNVFMFDDTIRNNLTMFQTFPEEAIRSATRRAGLSEVIRERGEDYLCGENGANLSGGERQRIQIARSLLRGSDVLLMDEATSALDRATGTLVMQAIAQMDAITRIVVTHNLEENTLRAFDEILMLKDGHIAEQGTYNQLMAQKGQFYALYTVSNA